MEVNVHAENGDVLKVCQNTCLFYRYDRYYKKPNLKKLIIKNPTYMGSIWTHVYVCMDI